jgi:hypothetical protein
MLDKIKGLIIPYLIGLVFILAGWLMSILHIGLSTIQTDTSITGKIPGLVLILIGAYIPPIWSKIRGKD